MVKVIDYVIVFDEKNRKKCSFGTYTSLRLLRNIDNTSIGDKDNQEKLSRKIKFLYKSSLARINSAYQSKSSYYNHILPKYIGITCLEYSQNGGVQLSKTRYAMDMQKVTSEEYQKYTLNNMLLQKASEIDRKFTTMSLFEKRMANLLAYSYPLAIFAFRSVARETTMRHPIIRILSFAALAVHAISAVDVMYKNPSTFVRLCRKLIKPTVDISDVK